MKRINIQPRNKWQDAVEKLGFGFHTSNVPYWDESAAYVFTLDEILKIEKATAELWDMSLAAVQHVMDQRLYSQFHIPEWIVPYIEKTWMEDHPAIYGRFDLAYNNGEIKLLEFNADTPTSLYEAGIVQWFWLQDYDKSRDQFNSVHEKLIGYWKYLAQYLKPGKLHFACLKETLEDLTNTEYMRDCAMQAGLETQLVFMDDIGWDNTAKNFVDLESESIKNIFKLYPWEWLINDDFGKQILKDQQHAYWIEPAWKMILSNKAILPILWKLFPEHPLLLKTSFSNEGFTNYVQKPLLSREGANISIIEKGNITQNSLGIYGEEGFVYQEYFPLFESNGQRPVLGSWIIGQQPAGMGIRETSSRITDNLSRFVPHFMEG